ncbi:hypothetical protein PGIGA_G00222010 [Pangasianodon gigas]|uniref:Uncharacterized protein n=1 Tax=Pangasianodon gigas TaxID=30993 RepID=A0ACC5WJ93_PANGG|nr:hypothetical protein [Pangasianodon gigas]
MFSLCFRGFLQVLWFPPQSKDMRCRLIGISRLSMRPHGGAVSPPPPAVPRERELVLEQALEKFLQPSSALLWANSSQTDSSLPLLSDIRTCTRRAGEHVRSPWQQ